MSSSPRDYRHQPLDAADYPDMGDKWLFAGVDLAPNEGLETGVAVVDRARGLVRLDKVNTNTQILCILESLGPSRNVVVSLDMPKSLSIQGEWRQEEIRMFPLRLYRPHSGEFTDRWGARAWALYDELVRRGFTVMLYFNYQAKNRLELFIPFRTRTPRGCRALQGMIKERLNIAEIPGNLSPISVLDAMIGAYLSWLTYVGTPQEHFVISRTLGARWVAEPLRRFIPKSVRKPRRRRY
ncbi:MAG: hypothetical protein IPK79_02500 [Vampirovibrionales bacterium]|nr:hypothetical protein [Vampirovibrionales bacterium]